jgi:predicted lipoprotein with Yx(FWY)xxD motif
VHLNRLRNRRTLAVATVLLLGTAAAACGSDNNNSSDTTAAAAATTAAATETTTAATEAPTTAAAPETTAAATTEAPEAGGESVKTAQTSLGTILVDGDEGKTLYIFMPDNKGPSTCTADCAKLWPALAGPATAGAGANASLLGTAKRTDNGTEQATYNGWPLYYFGGDSAAGQTNGQGIAGKWYVIDATGTPVDKD